MDIFRRHVRDFSGLGNDGSLLGVRWLFLRGVGVVYLFIFAGILVESRAMIGPHGVSPLAPYLADIRAHAPNAISALFAAPTVFWLGSGMGAILTVAWAGLLAAIALVLNWWPRLAVTICWVAFLSFVATWADFSSAQLDRLLLETALLCIPFAPGGIRPGLGADRPPRPIAVFALRWLLVRVMAESGWVKLISHDPHWQNLTAMDVMYETAPSPTILGYWAHSLPHAYHVTEMALTFIAELVAPLIAVVGGRRGRWLAWSVWTVFQLGIQLTCNFGWLNTAALCLGFLLLDDQMIADAAHRVRRGLVARWRTISAPRDSGLPPTAWRKYGLRVALGLQMSLTLFYVAEVGGYSLATAPALISGAVKPFAAFCSANGYFLYANFDTAHRQVDFEGSNDGGKTWRTYAYRHLPQSVDRISPFLAPWYPRFEATIQIEGWQPGSYSVLPIVARELLLRNPAVMERFARDPFPDRPPTVVRMRRYRLLFTSLETHRRTGRYWRKEYEDDFLPARYLTERAEVAEFDSAEIKAAIQRGGYRAARERCERQYLLGDLEAGFGLAEIYLRGLGVPEQPPRAVALFRDLAERGEIAAHYNLGLCYENGIGVPVDLTQAAAAYRRAIKGGSPLSLCALAMLLVDGRIEPRDDVEGLSLLLRAGQPRAGASALPASVRDELPKIVESLTKRMSSEEIARARAQ